MSSYVTLRPREIQIAHKSSDCAFWNARKSFSENSIAEFTERIRVEGLTTDLTVRDYHGEFQLVAGERRLRSLIRLLDTNAVCYDPETDQHRPARSVYDKIQCKLLKNCSDRFAITKSVSENMARENVSEVDLMTYCAELESHINEKGAKSFTRKEVAKLINRSETWVSQTLSLFDLPQRAIKALADGTIGRTVALYLLKVEPDTVNSIIDEAEKIEREVCQAEIRAQESLIEQTESNLERVELKIATQSGLGLNEGPQLSKAKELLSRKLEQAKDRQSGLKARKPRISKQSLQGATSQIPGALRGKESAMSHKAIRQHRDRLVEDISRGPILHHENNLAFDSLHVEIVKRVLDMTLGEGEPTPLRVLTALYGERNVPGWNKLAVFGA